MKVGKIYLYFFIFKVCYNLCCPHGYQYVFDEDSESDLGLACVPATQVSYSSVNIWDGDQK